MRFYGGVSFRRAGKDYGWALAVLALAISITAFYARVPEQVGAPSTGTNILIAPASGLDGFDVGPFCDDPLTKVKGPLPAPDASGNSYQLIRVRDGKSETVTLVLAPDKSITLATHYFDSDVGQVPEPAFLKDSARACVEKKASP